MCAAVLRPLSHFIARLDEKKLITAELIKQALGSETGATLSSLLQEEFQSSVLAHGGYRWMRENSGKRYILNGELSQQIAKELGEKSTAQDKIALLIKLFYPYDIGAENLIQLQEFYDSLEQVDDYVPLDQQYKDSYAYVEYEYTGGKVLSGRALTTLADNLGRHYVNSLMRTKSDWFAEDEGFAKQKYKFYNF